MRTRQEWELIIDNKATALGLALSVSALAEWKLWRDLAVTMAIVMEGIFLLFKKETSAHLKSEQHGSLYWYEQISKDFQNGDNLVVNNGIIEYATIDPSHRVITHVSVKEVGDDLLGIKVAKEVSGSLVKLSTTEYANYRSYISKRLIPGTKCITYTNDADEVNYNVEVYYDTLYAPQQVEANIVSSLLLFKSTFPFDSVLYKSAIIDAISNAEGVKGLGNCTITYTTDGSTNVLDNFAELLAGYFNYASGSALTLLPG